MLKIVTAPNQVLSKKAKTINRFDKQLIKLVLDMEETLIAQSDPQGVGLAAPQVGIGLSLFIMKPNPKAKTEAFVNPRILQVVEKKSVSRKIDSVASNATRARQAKKTPLEGCLSIPRIWGPIKRSYKIQVEYHTITGEKKCEWISGFRATIVQHEIDHLNGVLFTERSLEQKAVLYEEKEEGMEKLPSLNDPLPE